MISFTWSRKQPLNRNHGIVRRFGVFIFQPWPSLVGGNTSTGRIVLGTSGWSYQEWVGVFYPTASESKLKHYSRVFPTAEIDSTFYAFPQEGTVIGWDRYSPKGFIFNAKIPQTVTHEKLADLGPSIESDLDRYAELMQPLNNSGKLGCLLIQLPPK